MSAEDKRSLIWGEKDFFNRGDTRIEMDPTVVELPDDVLLTWGFNYESSDAIRGYVVNLHCEDGNITGELAFNDPDDAEHYWVLEEQGLVGATGFYDSIEMEEDADGVQHVTKARLRSVAMLAKSELPITRVADEPTS